MKSIPILFTGLAALAALAAGEKRAAGANPDKEKLCAGFNGDFEACQRETKVCFDETGAKDNFNWEKVIKCLASRRPPPTEEELCVGFNNDFKACKRVGDVCLDEIRAKENFTWEKVIKCVASRRPPPTKEELCVGFNNDFAACQKETSKCIQEIQDQGQDFSWDKVSKCVEGRLPSASGSAAPPPPAAAPTTKPGDKPAAPPQNNADKTTGAQEQAPVGATVRKADIRVDTNRDGIVDVDGTSDEAGKDDWTDAAGAIFLPNIADSGNRCKKLHTGFSLPEGLATLFDTLAKCHDAADDTQRAPQNLAPMRTMPITGLSDSATGTISIADEKSRGLVRVFRETKDGKWDIVKNDTVFTAQDLKAGLTLGVDARDTRRPDWDGRVRVAFTVRDGQTESTDTAMLRVAPVLLHHHNQAVNEVFTADFHYIDNDDILQSYMNTVVAGIQTSMKAADITGPLTRLDTDEVWVQDDFEPAYASMPGPNGTVVALRVIIEGRHNNERKATSIIYTALRGDGVGAVAQRLPRPADITIPGSNLDAGGNLESIPPYELNGKKYPAGRIITSGDSKQLPIGMDFLKAQEVQSPLVLDSTPLFSDHVDVMVQAVPAKTERGWAIIAIDAEMGHKMLRDAEAAGLGHKRVISRLASVGQWSHIGPTIAEFLNETSNTVAAEVVAKAMAANLEILKKETGLTDAEIHRVPALMTPRDTTAGYVLSYRRRRGISGRDEAAEVVLDQEFREKLPSHVHDEDETKADETKADETTTEQRRQAAAPESPDYDFFLPCLVNGVPLSDTYYLAPKPFGPIIDGKDIFEEAATAAYKKAGFTTIKYLEEWRTHISSGDLHCMSNTFRDTSKPWW